MVRKIIDGIVIILFVAFAGLQFNDPDPWFWILCYLLVAVIAGMSLLGRLSSRRVYTTIALFGVLLAFNFFKLTNWINSGCPDMINYTPDTVDIVEGIREFIGLLISFAVLFIYLLRIRGK